MKKFLALLLSLVMVLALVACGDKKDDTNTDDQDNNEVTDFKVGFIMLHDENSTYDLNFINAAKEACETLGVEYTIVTNVPEGQECYDKAAELADAGCNIIFADSFGHEDYMIQAAKDFPDVQFCHSTGTKAHTEGLANYHNAFAAIYEGRYLAGIAAGLKTETNKLGYVAAKPFAEVISGYTAFYLGIKSVYENAWMEVQYTGSWFDLSKENEAAKQLISDGCIIIGQHADSTGAPQACQEALKSGTTVYSIGYNIDMLATAPDAALTSATNNWGVYYTYAIAQAMRGQKVATNWVGGFDIGAVAITQLGSACAAGTAEKVAEVEKAIHDGTLQVFDTSKFTISTKCTDGSYRTDDNGKVLVACATDTDSNFANDTDNAIIDGAYQESYTQSAPSFVLRIDGIKELNANS